MRCVESVRRARITASWAAFKRRTSALSEVNRGPRFRGPVSITPLGRPHALLAIETYLKTVDTQ